MRNDLKHSLLVVKMSSITSPCRFCFAYTPSGTAATCCPSVYGTTLFSTLATYSTIVNNNTNVTPSALLIAQQSQQYKMNQSTIQVSTLHGIMTNQASIMNQLYGQLRQVSTQRYVPYQPYVYPVVPSSVLELKMRTANAGVSQSFFSYRDCRGNQSVTK